MVEVRAARRRRTRSRSAILLVELTLVFLLATVTLLPYLDLQRRSRAGPGRPLPITVLVALAGVPHPDHHRRAAVGDRRRGHRPHDRRPTSSPLSGRAVEAAGDVDVLLLDKTGTITLGQPPGRGVPPAPGIATSELADAAQLASLADETPEGRSIVILAKQKFGLRERDVRRARCAVQCRKFSAQSHAEAAWTARSRRIRKGAADACIRLRPEVVRQAFCASRSRFLSSGERALSKGVEIPRLIVWRVGLPTAIEDTNPLERQRTHCGLIRAAFVALLAIVGTGPERFVDGLAGPFDKRLAHKRWTLPAPMDPTLLATAFGDGRNAGVFLQLIGVLEASAILPEGGEQPWRQMRAGTR